MTKQLPSSDLITAQTQVKNDVGTETSIHKVGKIDSFNADGTVKVALFDLQEYANNESGGQFVQYSLITCTWIAPSGMIGSFQIGDLVYIGFNDRDLTQYYANAFQQPLETSRTHDISDGVILGKLQQGVQPNQQQTGFSLGGSELTVGESGIVSDSGDQKTSIKNNEASLQIIINNLITALTQIINTPIPTLPPSTLGALNPAIETAITDAQTDLNELLQ